MPAEIHVGSIGFRFRFLVKDADGNAKDLSSFTVKKVRFSRPSSSLLIVDASFTNDGTDGRIYYLTVDGDLSAAGTWRAQGYFETAGGSVFWTDVISFEVKRNLTE